MTQDEQHTLTDLTELRGIWLANDMVVRMRADGLRLSRQVGPPEGPHFCYSDGPSLFLGRVGRGPLRIAWDTNLLIDYFDYGKQLWEGGSLPEVVPAEHGEELEGLQVLVSLWVIRDIRFQILPRVIDDSRRKPLAESVRQRRVWAWREFCEALALSEDDGPQRTQRLRRSVDADEDIRALSSVPAGNDRALVSDALHAGAHVFLTCDKALLKSRDNVAARGLLVVSPLDLVEELAAAGALHCLLEPQHLYWPLPDQRRVSHLIRALMPVGEG